MHKTETETWPRPTFRPLRDGLNQDVTVLPTDRIRCRIKTGFEQAFPVSLFDAKSGRNLFKCNKNTLQLFRGS